MKVYPHSLAVIFLIVTSWVFYLFAICPTIYHSDSPELVVTAFTLGISHPAGFPLYNLLAKAATLIPLGSIAFKVNLFSLIAACLTLVAVYWASLYFLVHLFKEEVSTRLIWAAALPAGYLGFSLVFWFNAVQAEVYTLHAFFTAALILLLLLWRERKDARYLYAAALTYGLSAGNHATVAFYLPAILCLYFCWNRQNVIRNLSYCICFFLVGLSVYAYLPVRSLAEPSFDWGNPETLKGFLYQVTDRKDASDHFGYFRDNAEKISAEVSSFGNTVLTRTEEFGSGAGQVIKGLFIDIGKNFSAISWVGFLAGALLCLRASVPLFLFFFIIIAGNTSFFLTWKGESYFPTYLIMTMFTSAFILFVINGKFSVLWQGIKKEKPLPDAESRKASSLNINWRAIVLTGFALLIPFQMAMYVNQVDRSQYYQSESLMKRMYLTLPERSLFVSGLSWFHYNYHQDVDRLRDDVTSVTVWDLLSPDPPTMLTARRYPDLKLPEAGQYHFKSRENISDYIEKVFNLNSAQRPVLVEVCSTFFEQTFLTDHMELYRNVFLRYSSDVASIPSSGNKNTFARFRVWLDEDLQKSDVRTDFAWLTLPSFFLNSYVMYFHDTRQYELEREALNARFDFEGEGTREPGIFLFLDNLVKDNQIAEAENKLQTLRQKYSWSFERWMAEGLIQQGQGNWEQSIKHFEKAGELKPASHRPHLELYRTYLALNDFDKGGVELKAALARAQNLRELTQVRRASSR